MKITLNNSTTLEVTNVREEYNPEFKDTEKTYMEIVLCHDKSLSLEGLIGLFTKDAISKIIVENDGGSTEVITGYTKVAVLRREYLQDRVKVIVRLV